MSKDTFKTFAKSHPELAKNVMSGKTSWQKLYELYDIYGENSNVWDTFFSKPIEVAQSSIKDMFNTIKNLDMDSVQKGVSNLQKTIGLLQELGIGSQKETTTYEPKPIYRRFED